MQVILSPVFKESQYFKIIFYFCDQKNPFYEEVKPVDNELVIMQNPQIMNDPNGSKFMEERLRLVVVTNFDRLKDYFIFNQILYFFSLIKNYLLKMYPKSRKMTGEQFILTEVQQPPLFVVCRHRRLNSSQTQPIQFYYILDGTIRQVWIWVPQIYHIIAI